MPSVHRALLLVLAAFSVVLAGFVRDAGAADFALKPSITLSEEYNDNILLAPLSPQEEYITRVIPAVDLHYLTRFWIWDVSYALDYRHFERGTVKDDVANTLKLANHTEVVDNLFFIDVSDTLGRESLDIVRDFTQQSLVVNQAEKNAFTVKPYLVLKPSTNLSLTLAYLYHNTRYSNVPAGTNINPIDRFDNITYAEAKLDLSSRTTLTAGVRYTRDRNRIENYNQLDVYTGPQYRTSENFYLYFLVGKSRFDYEKGQDVSARYWNAGMNYRWSTVTVSLDRAALYIEDPRRALTKQDRYGATVRRETARTILDLSGWYSSYRDARSNELLATSQKAQGAFHYKFTPRTNGIVGATLQEIHDEVVDTTTRINLSTLRVERLLSEKTTLAFEYRHLRSDSPGLAVDNYSNNRFTIAIGKVF